MERHQSDWKRAFLTALAGTREAMLPGPGQLRSADVDPRVAQIVSKKPSPSQYRMRRVAAAIVGIVAIAVLASAQQQNPAKLTVTARVYDKTHLLSAPVLPEDAQRGRALWLQRCAYCHDGVGQPTYKTMGPWLGAETVQALGETSFRAFVAAGSPRMPGFRYTLQQQQVSDLISFLKTVSSSQKPTPGQLAGTQAVGDTGQ